MIYTRNYGKNSPGTMFSPPPGYDGSAFPPTSVKLHEAEDDVSSLRRKKESLREDSPAETEPADGFSGMPVSAEADDGQPQNRARTLTGGIDALEGLFRQLKGKFGREELIIVLVMLLISSEGASLELMLLALILIAG